MPIRTLMLPAVLLLCAGAGSPTGDDLIRRAREAEARRVRLVKRISPSVVAVFRTEGRGGGSGVIIDPAGYVLTNFHVVGDASELRVGLPGGRVLRGKVIGIDPSSDLALVRLLGIGPFPHVPIGDSDALSVGDWTMAMGNPFLLATDFHPTVTLGIVSRLHRFLPGPSRQLTYADCVQVDTPINPGNSGGPLFNMRGDVIGINGRISGRDRGRLNVGVGFAVSAHQIREVLSDLRAGKLIEHGSLEATVREIEDPNAPGGRRIIVDKIYEDAAAAIAGLNLGDEIIEFDGTPVRSQNHFLNLLGVLPSGRTVHIVYRRKTPGTDVRTEGSLRVTLVRLPSASAEMRKGHTPDPDHLSWETGRILRRHRDRSGIDPTAAVGWEGTRVSDGGESTRIRSIRGGTNFRQEIGGGDSGDLRITTLDDKGARSRSGQDWTPLDEDLASELQAEVQGLEAIAHGEAKRFRNAVFVGGDKIAGRLVDTVRTTLPGGKEIDWLFEVETGLLAGYRFRSSALGQNVLVRLSDYRSVGGIRRPFRIDRGVEGGPGVHYRIERYLRADEIPEELHRRPEEPDGKEF